MPRRDVPDNDRMSRFCRERYVAAKTGSLRPGLFKPRANRVNGRLELSMCASEGMSEEESWGVCTQHFDAASPDPAIGRADGRAGMLYEHRLSIERNDRPYPRHCDVIDWPLSAGENEADTKSASIEIANDLAGRFTFVGRTDR